MLEALLGGALEDAAARRRELPLAKVERDALAMPPAIDALEALAPRETIHVIAEIKRASPSRGPLADIPEPSTLARDYAFGGASAISVLTEERRFGGSLRDLREVRESVDTPVLRKDFIAEEYQILEARAAGADLVLLIVASLEQRLLSRLHDFILELGMTPLVETHSGEELSRAADIGARLIGVNARDLSTFELDRGLFGQLASAFPADAIKVAESAVNTVEDVVAYREAGADVVLVGEALVTGGDPAAAVSAFIEATASEDEEA